MWQYGIGSPPATKKAKLTGDEKKKQASQYEKDGRDRKFKEHWRQEFPWVRYIKASGGMTCVWCLTFPAAAGPHTSFITQDGCTTHHEIEYSVT